MLSLTYAFIIGVIVLTPIDDILIGLAIVATIAWWRKRSKR